MRSILEFNSCVWHFNITQAEENDIERVQKIAIKVILNEHYEDYDQACQLLHTQSLQSRRVTLSLKFALQCLKNENHKHFFKPRSSQYYTLRNLKSFEEPFCHSDRYKSSPLPYLTRLLNNHFENLASAPT